MQRIGLQRPQTSYLIIEAEYIACWVKEYRQTVSVVAIIDNSYEDI